MAKMKAVVIRELGGPDVLKIENLEIPQPKPGWVLIRVEAFGLNRAEHYFRIGTFPGLTFPRVLGIEAVGEVVVAPDGGFTEGDRVATAMGGMGRDFDGGYAEYTLVPAGQVQKIETSLPWEVFGALPEMFQTAWGALNKSLRVKAGETLLIRGGTSSVGLAAAILAKQAGLKVVATTRREDRREMLLANGADEVVIGDGKIAEAVRALHPEGVDRVLELVGASTMLDSLKTVKPGGSVAMTGLVGESVVLENFMPGMAIPKAVNLTTYGGDAQDFMATPLQRIVQDIEAGVIKAPIGRTFGIDDIVEAHRVMDDNAAGGKIVVLT